MAIRRDFGSLRASPELTDTLLCNIRHRRNATVGYFNRTGKHFNNHFDDWIRDEIVELATELGTRPSFSIPDVLATRIMTNETFGIIAVPASLVQKYGLKSTNVPEVVATPVAGETPVHLMTRLSTRPTSPYIFLAECQQTMHAVVPVHTPGEHGLFTNLLESGNYFNSSSKMPAASHTARTVNFDRLTQRWNEIVHEWALTVQPKYNRIYYKLPEQLEHHHKL
jgi:hypothetical protein